MCACGSLHWPWLPPPWSDSILSKRAWRWCWQHRLCLSLEQHQHQRVWSRSPVLGWAWPAGRSTRPFAVGRLHAVTCSRRVSVAYSPPVNPPGFHTALMGLFTGCLTKQMYKFSMMRISGSSINFSYIQFLFDVLHLCLMCIPI